MRSIVFLPVLALLFGVAQDSTAQTAPLHNPYERVKNGPPLTGVFHKAMPSWLLKKLREPQHHPSARMPDFKFTEEEALDILSFLRSIAGETPKPAAQWPSWAKLSFDDLDGDDFDAVQARIDRGQAVWGSSRCTICHKINGPSGALIGGFVDLRVGGADLQIAGEKLKRDWLLRWIEDPKNYFSDTLMPRFRLPRADQEALVEYILREDVFLSSDEEEEAVPAERWKTLEDTERVKRGKRLVEISRCVVCHEVEGIPEVITIPPKKPLPPKNTFEFLAYDVKCLSCHAIGGVGGTYAPDLSTEGSRLREQWVADFVHEPDLVRPLSQQMPKLNLTKEEASLSAEYMAKNTRSKKIPAEIPGGAVTTEEVAKGQALFNSKGCTACHTAGVGPGGLVGPDLAAVGDRLRPGYIWFHIKNPHEINPYSAEPDYGHSPEECRALAAFLAGRKK